MAEAVSSKSVTGGRRISWGKNCLSRLWTDSCFQEILILNHPRCKGVPVFFYTFGILHVACIFLCVCVCSVYTAVSIPEYVASIL